MLQRLDFAASSLAKRFGGEAVLVASASSVIELLTSTGRRVEMPGSDVLFTRASDFRQSADGVLGGNDASAFASVSG